MPYTLKTSQISVKDPETGEYSGVDILAEQTEEGLIAELQAEGTKQVNRITQAAVDVQSAVDKAETDAAKIISDTQTSVNTLESQKNTIAQTVASMAELGTDTTLSTPGMAADAGAVGDLNRQISDVENNQIPELKSIVSAPYTETGHYVKINGSDIVNEIKTNINTFSTALKLSVGSGNFLPFPFYDSLPRTHNGVTFSVDPVDNTLIADGTATADATFQVVYDTDLCLPVYDSRMYISGVNDGSLSTYYLRDRNGYTFYSDNSQILMPSGTGILSLALVIKVGTQLTNKRFPLMLSLNPNTSYEKPSTIYTVNISSSDTSHTWENIQVPDSENVYFTVQHDDTVKIAGRKYLTASEISDFINTSGTNNQWKSKTLCAFGTSLTDTGNAPNTYDPDGNPTGKYLPYLIEIGQLAELNPLPATSGVVLDHKKSTNFGIAGGSINGHILYYIRYYLHDVGQQGMSRLLGNYADIITIEGSVNDYAGNVPLGQVGDTVPYTNGLLPDGTSEGTFAGACYCAFTEAQEYAPNSLIVFLTDSTGKYYAGNGNNYNQLRKNSLGLYQKDYIDMAVAVAKFVGIPVIECGSESMINAQNPDYLVDWIHHTYLGGYQYAKTIWSHLKHLQPKATSLPNS